MFPWYVPPATSIREGSPGDIRIVSSSPSSSTPFQVRSSVDRSRRFDVSRVRTVFPSSRKRLSETSAFSLHDASSSNIPTPSHEIQCASCSNRGNCMTYLDSNWRHIVFASSPRTLTCWDEAETNENCVRTESTSEAILQIESLSKSAFVVRHKTMFKVHNFSSSSSSFSCAIASKHLAASRTCPEISALKSDCVVLWDMQTNKSKFVGRAIRDAYHFISHDYAIHPRTLCLTTRRSSIVTLDLRSGRHNPLYVFVHFFQTPHLHHTHTHTYIYK